MRRFSAAVAALIAMLSIMLSACAPAREEAYKDVPRTEVSVAEPVKSEPEPEAPEPEEAEALVKEPQPQPEEPKTHKAAYFSVDADGVNIRSGAGTDCGALGTAEKGTLYALSGECGRWYKTYYKNRTAYIYSDYCTRVDMDICADERIEKVIETGCRYMGVKYVYGAVRYHDGTGRLLGGFSEERFDCSSLMQYIFKRGAGINLQVNTRTQVFQGRTIERARIERGDLLFFTNASRVNKTGVERVGHVALYLGDNYILHTASDYAKIEKISAARQSYYIQAQRII